jgi:hypothetical protein
MEMRFFLHYPPETILIEGHFKFWLIDQCSDLNAQQHGKMKMLPLTDRMYLKEI